MSGEIRTELSSEEKKWFSTIAFIIAILVMALLILAFNYFFPSDAKASLNNLSVTNYTDFGNNIPTEKQQRQSAAEECFSDAELIAGEDEKASNLLAIFQSLTYLIEPALGYDKNFLPLEPEREIGILPLLPEDSANISWQEEFSSEKIVGYDEIDGMPIIILGNNPATKTSRGLALLQTIFLVSHKDKMTMAQAYVKAAEMSFRLLHNKFEEIYEEIVQEEIAAFKAKGYFVFELSSVRLEEIYGKTFWEDDKNFQCGILYLEVAFRIIEEKYPNNIPLTNQIKIKILSCGEE